MESLHPSSLSTEDKLLVGKLAWEAELQKKVPLPVLSENEMRGPVCEQIHQFRRTYGHLPNVQGLPCDTCSKNQDADM